jgi:pimeloyl-ACP methyl ester carboxylesterase
MCGYALETRWLLLLALLVLLNACAVFDKATPGWYESRQQFPTVEGIHLHYKEYGRGDPILFIHGFGESIYTWRHLLAPLATHHRVIALDLKGFGDSPKLQDGRYTLYDQARLVYQFIVEHNLKNLTLVGHSLGGGVALVTSLYLAETSPKRQKRLILIDSIAYPQEPPGFIKVLATPILGPLFVSLVPEKVQVSSVLEMVYYHDEAIPEDAVRVYAEHLKKPGAKQAVLQTARQVIPSDIEGLSQKYSQITTPTLILWGEEDKLVPLSMGQRLHIAIPDSKLVVFENIGHAPQEEHPAGVLSAVETFLADEGKDHSQNW